MIEVRGHGEQEVLEEKLQLQVMNDTVDNVKHPGTAVMLTEDVAGSPEGPGFWASLQRMKSCG